MSGATPHDHHDAARHERVFAVFQRVCDLPSAERVKLLDQECAGDAALRERVESLLRYDSDDDEFLEARSISGAAHATAHSADSRGVPAHIGRYRLIREIGAGGMGIVYEAEQESPKRRVALKVMRARGGSAGQRSTRFIREGQIQAGLVHPCIAQIYETGIETVEGRPTHFMVMELIEGVSLSAYLRDHELSIDQRVELMLSICEGVSFAHQRGVIHRDLKPANVLVCGTIDGPKPKILDFGIAKLTNHELGLASMQTSAGEILGTLAYMSPEQVSGKSADVDTRSDIYALGLILYEMLTGRLPIDVRELSVPEALRRITEDAPSRLSTLSPGLRGDLETIVHKAIDKDKTRRYDSIFEFAADLRRFLRDEPISARPPSAIYQLRKFARRNRTIVGSLAAVLVVLVAAVVALTFATINANRARDIAERETAVSEGVSQALLYALTAATPKGSLGKEPLLIDAVHRIESQIEDPNAPGGTNIPEVQAVVHNIAGIIHRERGDLDRAETSFAKALEIRRTVLDPGDPNLADSINNMGLLRRKQGRHAEAAVYYEQAVALQRVSSFRDDTRLARNIYNLASTYIAVGEFAKAKPLLAESLAMHELIPNVHPEILGFHISAQARIAIGEKKWAEALDLAKTALAAQREAVGLKHPTVVLCLNDLATVRLNTGEAETAVSLLREAEAMGLELFPTRGHQTIRMVRENLIQALRATNRDEEADTVKKSLDEDHS